MIELNTEKTRKKIKAIIAHYERMTGSRDPIRIAKFAGRGVVICQLGELSGFYKLIKRKKWIFINEDLMDTDMFRVVAAHELGHAFLHRTKECAFIKNHTLLLTSWVEREANLFAAELLIPDYNQYQVVYPKELLHIMLSSLKLDFTKWIMVKIGLNTAI